MNATLEQRRHVADCLADLLDGLGYDTERHDYLTNGPAVECERVGEFVEVVVREDLTLWDIDTGETLRFPGFDARETLKWMETPSQGVAGPETARIAPQTT